MDPAAASTRFPGFRHHLRAVVNNGEGVYLFSESGVIALRGPHIASLAPLLNGQHDLATLFRSRPGGLDPEQVASLVGQLVEANLVALRQTAQAPADERAQAYWDACGVRHAPDGPAGRVGVVDLIGGDGLDARAVERALGRAGVATLVRTNGVVPDTSADLTVVVCDDYLRPELADIDRAYRAAGRPWLLTKPVGAQTWIGPVFQPGDTGCLSLPLSRTAASRMSFRPSALLPSA